MTDLWGRKENVEVMVDGEEESAVATVNQETSLAIPSAWEREGMEDIDRDDLIIPRARVIQPTSKLDGNPGEFHLNLTGETRKVLHAVLLKVTKTRVCWDADDLSAPPMCASDDAKTPRAETSGRFATTCDGCPMAEWGENSEAPQCRLTYNFLAADLEREDTPFILSLSGASVKQAKKVISAFFLTRKPLYSRPVVINAVEVKNDKGRYYEVVLTPNGGGRGFDWQPYRAIYQAYQSVTVAADTEQTLDPTKGSIEEMEEIPF